MRRIQCLLPLLLTILLTACQPAKATQPPTRTLAETKSITTSTTRPTASAGQPTPTHTPTAPQIGFPTPYPEITDTPTPTQTPHPASLFGKTPGSPANQYQIKPDDGESMWSWIIADKPELPAENGKSYNSYNAWPKAEITLLREFVARFPDSPYATDAQVRLIFPSSYTRSAAPIEPFRSALETALNAEPGLKISAETVNPIIASVLHLDEKDYKDFPFANVLPADNVLADGEPGWVLGLRVPAPAGTALALAGKPGAYRLVSVRENWRIFAWDDQQVFTYDLNANGIPEIAIWDSYWGTGMSHFCDEVFELYEWNGSQFVNLTPDLITSANIDSGACLNFEFVPGPNRTQAITTGNLIDSGCYDGTYDRSRGIGSLTIKRRYEWNGRYFALAGETVEPLQNSIPADWPIINKCTLSWVNEAGVNNDQAFQLLPTLLAETDPELTTAFADEFGPAYLDYFRFKLGIWYAIRGQQSAALALLNQVRDAPANIQFDTASQLAGAFLQAYPSIGTYAGCAAAQKLLDIDEFVSELPGILNTGAMRDTWGFSEYQWAYGSGTFFSGPSGRDDPLNLCSLPEAFRSSVQKQSFTTSQNLRRWLEEQQIPYTGLQEGDVDGDGRSDWSILLGTGVGQSWHLWALLNHSGAIQPVWVADAHHSTGNIPTAWNTFTPNPLDGPLNIYQWTDGMSIFRIIPQDGALGAEIIRPLTDYYYSNTFLGFTVLPAAEGRPVASQGAEELRVVLAEESPWQSDRYILGWDPALNRLRDVSSPQYDQDQKIRAIENLLFEKSDPQAALEMLKFIEGNGLYDIVDPAVQRYDDLPEVLPYLQYLLGLAYEMSGDEANAVTAYWNLWNEHPLHPLSYVVQQKLEKKK